jgi:3-phosphoshikimate 1-carboxyvinyltransferase
MNVLINPKPLTGTIQIPPSKSLSHRAVIAASLSKGKSVIRNIVLSDDVLATVDAMEKIGVRIVRQPRQLVIHGLGKVQIGDDNFFDCNESGSTLRFLIPVLALSKQKFVLTGKPGLFKRPLQVFETLFKERGFFFQQNETNILVSGTLEPGVFEIPGNVSSQFISGYLFALPLLREDSRIVLTTPLESAEYTDLTVDMLRQFGVRVDKTDEGFYIYGNQSYKASSIDIESDYSQLAFFAVAGALSGPITAKHFRTNSLQPDRRVVDIVRQMGGIVDLKNGDYVFSKAPLCGTTIDVSQCPDIAPVLGVLGGLSEGETHIVNAQRLKIKETNRIKTTADTLSAFGVDVQTSDSTIDIVGTSVYNGGVFDSFGDHRIAMAIAIGAIKAKSPVVIKNAEAVNKSYPNFFRDYQSLGGDVTYIEE